MNTQALITMVATNLVVAGFTAYFFWKVLKKPMKDGDADSAD